MSCTLVQCLTRLGPFAFGSNLADVLEVLFAICEARGYSVEELMDVRTPLVTYTLPATNQCYFYVFFENETRKIASGKFAVKQ